jgi:hypothetical protein
MTNNSLLKSVPQEFYEGPEPAIKCHVFSRRQSTFRVRRASGLAGRGGCSGAHTRKERKKAQFNRERKQGKLPVLRKRFGTPTCFIAGHLYRTSHAILTI